jgi:hypothetical protein
MIDSQKVTVLCILHTFIMWFAPVPAQGQVVERGEEYLVADPVLDKLIYAIAVVESNLDSSAVGDTNLENKAYGILQIRQPAIDDFNRWHGTGYRAEDCLDNTTLSVMVCRSYLRHYGTEERLGDQWTIESLARIWNGGPNGYKKQSTEKYWGKVSQVLESLRKESE